LKESVKWYRDNKADIRRIKRNMWVPKSLDDYKDLNIKVIPCDTDALASDWKILRTFCSVAIWNNSPGRMGKFMVVHETEDENADPFGFGIKQNKWEYLGILSLGSDFLAVGGRDEKIGWTDKDKFGGKLNYIAMASTIVPTQPLGYNYLGGKLVSLLAVSDVVENYWNSKYTNEVLAGVTTTSLYGGFSQYNNLKYWKKCRSTEGKVEIEPTEDVYEKTRKWLMENYPQEYQKITKEKTESGNIKSHPKSKILAKAKTKLKVRGCESNAPRGVYWCPLYENSEKFLRNEDTELTAKRFDNSVSSLVNLWKEKYASKRISKFSYNQLSDILFLDDLIGSDWEQIKEKYLKGEE